MSACCPLLKRTTSGHQPCNNWASDGCDSAHFNLKNVNEEVELYGWVARKRDLGGLIFIDLRDASGIIQLVVNPENKNYKLADTLKSEFVIEATGKIVERSNKNPNIPTGDIDSLLFKDNDPSQAYLGDKKLAVIDMGDYYRIPADNRNLNYQKYIDQGNVDFGKIEDYNSHNTKRLNVKEMKELLLKLDLFEDCK